MGGAFSDLRVGWRNLSAAVIGIGLGIAAYTPVSSLFFRALELEFGWSKAAAAAALIALPITALVLPIAGWLIDKLGVRLMTGFSVVCSVVSYIWLANLKGGLPEYYGAILLLNVLGCASGPIAYTRLVAAQYTTNRGLALAVAQFGIAFIGVFMPQLIGWMLGAHGWRSGYLVFAAATLIGGVIAQLLMQPGKTQAAASGEGVSLKAALATGPFWALGIAILAISAASFGLVAQFQAFLLDRGFSLGVTTALLSLLAFSIMVSRLVVGRLLDLSNPGRWAGGVMLVAAVGALTLLFGPHTLPITIFAVILFGFSIGAELDLMSFFCARLFGLRHYASIYGLLSSFFYIGIAFGGLTYSIIRQKTGSYDGGLIESTLLFSLAAALLYFLPESLKQPAHKGAALNDAG